MELKIRGLRQEVKLFRKTSGRVTRRLLALIELARFRQKWGRAGEQDYERIAQNFEIGGRSLYRWEAAYKRGGVVALRPRKPAGRPRVAVRGHTARKIRNYRRLYNWGAEVIQAHLLHDFGIKISRYKINRYLRHKGLLVRKTCKPRKKHTRVVKVSAPGAHTQIDVKHLPQLLANHQKCYVYNFVDHASKWAFKKAYDSIGPSETRDFIRELLETAPFPIVRLQSDNGIEFTYKYVSHLDSPKLHALDELCDKFGIRHVLIPPGEKELQGLVERSHRQDDEELFHRIRPADLASFNKSLREHCQWRNSRRRRKALGWKTADEFLAEHRTQFENWLYADGESPFQIQAVPGITDEPVVSAGMAA